jgi:hypothetical protein
MRIIESVNAHGSSGFCALFGRLMRRHWTLASLSFAACHPDLDAGGFYRKQPSHGTEKPTKLTIKALFL